MSTPFYVSPEQLMKDRADFARKGIARGRSVIVLTYTDGILMVAENGSTTLHKVSEIYDRLAFAAVGKYNEFENLRVAGVRLADLRGYSYDRRDVTGRALANAYAQTLGTIFTQESKPYEVEIVVAEVGDSAETDQMYRLTYDGSVFDERTFVVMGGMSEPISTIMREGFIDHMPLDDGLRLAVRALSEAGPDEERRTLTAAQLEVAVLDRTRPGRTFRRLTPATLQGILGDPEPAATRLIPGFAAARGAASPQGRRRPEEDTMPATSKKGKVRKEALPSDHRPLGPQGAGDLRRDARRRGRASTATASGRTVPPSRRLKRTHEKVGDHWEPKEGGAHGPSDDRAEKRGLNKLQGAGGVDARASKAHLMSLASELDVKGRSRMTKAELVEALMKANRRATSKAGR